MTIITAGVQGGLGTRQEIRTFFQDADLTNLFILALESFQAVDQNDPLSWYQIAGIHGRPYAPYDGVGTPGHFGGYCTHSSILFPTWHRPYLALYEQALTAHVNKVAGAYTDPALKTKYQAAAARFRIPYWDWASQAVLPDIIAVQTTINVIAPTGQKSIPNPLYQYKFHPVRSDFADGLPDERTWEAYGATIRYPSTSNPSLARTAVSQPARMNAQLNNNKLTLRDRTYNLLTQATNYSAFSNDGFLGSQSDPRYYDSLESIHGQIHGLVGQNGHMGVVDFAAFDPVFWLHHANVDRLFAIWQAINPTQFIQPRANLAGTFTTQPGTVENADSALTPFWRAQGQMWTSNGARDTRTFGYTYPELAQWSSLSVEDKRVRLRQTVNELYGRTAPSGTVRTPTVTKPAAAVAAAAAPPAQPPQQPQHVNTIQPVPASRSPPAATSGGSAGSVGSVSGNIDPHQQAQPQQHAHAQSTFSALTKSGADLLHSAAAKISPSTGAARDGGSAGSSTASGGGLGGLLHQAGDKVAHLQDPGLDRGIQQGTALFNQAISSIATKVPQVQQFAIPTQPHADAPVVHPQVLAAQPHAGERSAPATGAPAARVAQPSHGPEAGQRHAGGHKITQYHEWIANIRVQKYAVDASFFVHVFLGDFNPDPNTWSTEPNLVGSHVVFTSNPGTGCARCMHHRERETEVTGTIPLTGALGDKFHGVTDLKPQMIVPYLQKELHWRIVKLDGTVIERQQIPSLKLSVGHTLVDVPDSETEFPTWGQVEMHLDVTRGRPGGAAEADL